MLEHPDAHSRRCRRPPGCTHRRAVPGRTGVSSTARPPGRSRTCVATCSTTPWLDEVARCSPTPGSTRAASSTSTRRGDGRRLRPRRGHRRAPGRRGPLRRQAALLVGARRGRRAGAARRGDRSGDARDVVAHPPGGHDRPAARRADRRVGSGAAGVARPPADRRPAPTGTPAARRPRPTSWRWSASAASTPPGRSSPVRPRKPARCSPGSPSAPSVTSPDPW